MTGEALQIDFRPQPRGIAVVTSAPISSIAESGNYSAFQDLIDGYASSFAKVHVFSPSGDPVVKPVKGHRVAWHSGPKWMSPTNGLWWSMLANRREFDGIELVRTFGPRAGVVGRALSRLSKSPHVSSTSDLVGNEWRDREGWRSTPSKMVNSMGMLKADVLSATLDWELDYLSDTGYKNDLLLGKTGLATDIYSPVGTTDPGRHPVVLWAGSVNEANSLSLIEESSVATQMLIGDVEFVVVVPPDDAEDLRTYVRERDLPVTVVSADEIEPLVDLIERTWACVTNPSRGFPHALAMFTAAAGIPLLSLGELGEEHGFKNHLNYISIEPDDPEGVVYGLQLLRRWPSWSLRIGSAGQKLIDERYSTKTVAIREGEQLARIAGDEDPSLDMPSEGKVLRPFISPAAGEVVSLDADDEPVVEEVEDEVIAEADYSGAGFDLVAAALDDISGSKPASSLTSDTSDTDTEPAVSSGAGGELDQDAISTLFAASDPEPEPEALPVAEQPEQSAGELDQDAISALFAANDFDPDPDAPPVAEPPEPSADELDQDAISALFAANDSEPEPEAQQADDPPEPSSDDLGQDAITALFAENNTDDEPEPESTTSPVDESTDDEFGQDAISALFAEIDASAALPEIENPLEIDIDDAESEEIDQDIVSAIIEAKARSAEKTITAEDIDAEFDLPDVNPIQFDELTDAEEIAMRREFESVDVDSDLIASILEGKDVDPSE